MPYHFRNLVFEGGGVKGIAYAGAMEALGRRRILSNITRVGGTSAGAINATLFALGYSNRQTRDLLAALDFNTFLDDDWGVLRDGKRVLTDFGWYKGDTFREWIGERVKRKLGNAEASFSDLRAAGRPDLYVYGTHLNTRLGKVFSAEHTPKMSIVDAVRISMSIPLYFAAVRERQNIYVDGGLLDNFPVKLFDRLHYIDRFDRKTCVRDTDYYAHLNKKLQIGVRTGKRSRRASRHVYNRQTLGLRLDSPQEISAFRDGKLPAGVAIDDFFDYAKALVGTVLEAQASQHLHSDDWQRTIYIDTGDVATTDFGLSAARKKKLIAAGRTGVKRYFDWFNSPECESANTV